MGNPEIKTQDVCVIAAGLELGPSLICPLQRPHKASGRSSLCKNDPVSLCFPCRFGAGMLKNFERFKKMLMLIAYSNAGRQKHKKYTSARRCRQVPILSHVHKCRCWISFLLDLCFNTT